jgi:hypothetical protein
MIKHEFKLYISDSDLNKLKDKAKSIGLEGRGSISAYIVKIANEPIAFLDDNLLGVLKALKKV